ncbi:uncharacterized protein BBA_01778 [Beauveria bassiana ARSEF 2860]|uniref:Uncharacterized protein n=1 Tax=Beauveria bassiana (strain ARSEF 2860) TaxID=655819 RepID=J5JVS0_BEAB2|nr:uncharacterized protein BBA_01778 [Beauveria bassiana ARSEF 2860]EJP68743.1 hypothetical protein BBA_01778 [Beauveria bassiana ARSEF 2860]
MWNVTSTEKRTSVAPSVQSSGGAAGQRSWLGSAAPRRWHEIRRIATTDYRHPTYASGASQTAHRVPRRLDYDGNDSIKWAVVALPSRSTTVMLKASSLSKMSIQST